jgi:hypothetical protein
MRWYHIRCIKGRKVESKLTQQVIIAAFPSLDCVGRSERLQRVLLTPIERGGDWGIAGNGRAQLWAWDQLKTSDRFPSDWESSMGQRYVKEALGRDYMYFYCPDCNTAI